MKDSFVFYRSFFEAIKDLDDKKRLKMFDSITKFALENEENENLNGVCKQLFVLIKPQILANNAKLEQYERDVENGKKGAKYGKLGGRPAKNNQDFKNPLKTPGGFLENNPPKNPINVNDNVNVNVNDNVNVECEEATQTPTDELLKNWYGEYQNVHLTDRQYNMLLTEILDKDKLAELIGELSENIACGNSKAPPYDENKPDMHYALLRKYWRFRRLNGGSKPQPQTQADRAAEFKKMVEDLGNKYRLKEVNSG